LRGRPSSGGVTAIRLPTKGPDAAWRLMIAINVAIFPALFAYKLFFSEPFVQYQQLLVTYHFGFAKRALIGTVLSWLTTTVPLADVYILGLAAWLVTAGLFVLAFKRLFGFDRGNLPLFAFVFGSPFFLKNFMYSIGYFDIYGCMVGFIALLIPAGPFYPFVIGAACGLLILIHHLHFLLYLPTICLIVFVRYYWLANRSPLEIAGGLLLALTLGAVFVAAAFFGDVAAPRETLIAYMQHRATDYFPADVSIWYSSIAQETRNTAAVLYRNAWRLPIYLALIALHLPVIKVFRSAIASLAESDRRMVVLATCAITLSYLVIFAVVYDYARWVCNWAVCMLLVMHAVRLLPSAAGIASPAIAADDRTNLPLASIITLIPRVGITKPF